MPEALPFAEVPEHIETLSLDDQEIFGDTLHRRIIGRRGEELVQDLQQARQEFQTDQSQSVAPGELMYEISA